ncbi:hypothetical protein MTO96_016369 [Rhipicephalus appendiculatus]
MEVQVDGTDMDPSQYDPRDWTQVLRAQANLRETRKVTHGTNADPSVRATPSQLRETPESAGTPALLSSSTQLRVLRTTAQKIKQLPPLPPDGYKVVFRSQGGLDLKTLQPRDDAEGSQQQQKIVLGFRNLDSTCFATPLDDEGLFEREADAEKF